MGPGGGSVKLEADLFGVTLPGRYHGKIEGRAPSLPDEDVLVAARAAAVFDGLYHGEIEPTPGVARCSDADAVPGCAKRPRYWAR